MKKIVTSICLVGGLLAASSASYAITLKEVISKTLSNSPALSLFPFSQRAAEARTLQAGLRPNPELSLEVENFAGSGEMRRMKSAEYTLLLSQMIELGDKREWRQSVARADGSMDEQDMALTRLEVLAESTRRYIDVLKQQEALRLARNTLQTAKRALTLAQQRVAAGAGAASETAKMMLAVSRAEQVLYRTDNALKTARLRLAASWGDEAANFSAAQDDLYALPTLPAFDALQKKLLISPEMTKLMTVQRLREAQLRLAESGAKQNVNVGVGVRHFSDVDDNALVFSFSMPLAVHDRNQGNIAEARVGLEKNAAEQQVASLALSTVLKELYWQADSDRQAAQMTCDKDIPTAKRALSDVETGYTSGKYSSMELVTAQEDVYVASQACTDAAAAFYQTVLEIERLTGSPVLLASKNN